MVPVAEAGNSAAELVRLRDEASGLDGVVAIHSTALGPGAGGCRLWHYPSEEAMANDALRLAEGMSYKNAMAGLPLGGAKAVLRHPGRPFDRAALFRAFGRAVHELGGRYVTAEDVGTSVTDMEWVARETGHVAGLSARAGRAGGDPSPWTARGVFVSMRLAAERRLGRTLGECTVAIQGVGHVGAALAEMLHEAGARLLIADISVENTARVAAATRAEIVDSGAILGAEADIFAPCALGTVLDGETIGTLRAGIVCGAANNQLASVEDGVRLAERGILYAPDYVVNAGGIVSVAAEYLGWTRSEAAARVEAIAERLAGVLDYAERKGLSANFAADALARKILKGSGDPVPAIPGWPDFPNARLP